MNEAKLSMGRRAERWESLKASGIGALATTLTAIALAILADPAVGHHLAPGALAPAWVVDWAIAGLAGALFGLTTRYAQREDRNGHLTSGTVLAFGLVRGLAQTEAATLLTQPLTLLYPVGTSLLLFAVAQLALEGAIAASWLARCPAILPEE